MSLEQHDVGPAALREVVGRRRAYYSAAYDDALRLFWHRAEAPRVHSQSVQHGCTAGWSVAQCSELRRNCSGNDCTCGGLSHEPLLLYITTFARYSSNAVRDRIELAVCKTLASSQPSAKFPQLVGFEGFQA